MLKNGSHAVRVLCLVIVVYSVTFIGMGKCHSDDTNFIRDTALDGRYQLDLPDDDIEPEPQVNRPVLKGAGGHSRHQQKRHVIPPRIVRVVE